MNQVLEQIEGKYEILYKLAEGGMGAVYKVRHRLLEEVQVIKVLRPQHAGDPRLQQRFLHEAKMAIRLRHPNVAQLYDFSIDRQGTAYIVMEYIDGVTVDDVLGATPPPSLDLGLEIARQALDAISYLHLRGLVHRDISPDNLMLTRGYHGGATVKLIDLGIAKRLDADVGLTRTGTFMGKVRYSSPEQFADGGAVDLDARSDLYSFGVLLYEILTGRSPIGGESLSQIVAAHLFHPPLDFAASDPDGRVPEELRAATLKALAKDPAERFQSGAELAAVLRDFGDPEAVLDTELERVLEPAGKATEATVVTPKAGSTQDRLDQQFGLREVLSLDESPPPAGSQAGVEPAATGRSAADPTDERIEALRAEVRAALERQEGKPAPRQPLSTVGKGIDKLIQARGLDEALAVLDSIAAEGATSSQIDELRSGVAAAAAAVTEIGRLLDRGELELAAERLTEAETEHGDSPELAELRRRLDQATAAATAEPDPAVAEAVASIRREMEAGSPETAAKMLAFARRRLGDHPELDALAEKLS